MLTMATKKIGVYLLCAGRMKFFKPALISVVEANSYGFPVIISDNSSLEHVEVELKSLASEYNATYRKNSPSSTSLFSHIDSISRESEFEYTCILHDDDIVYKNYFDILLDLINRYPHASAVACNAHLIFDETISNKKFLSNGNSKDFIISDYLDLLGRYFSFSNSFPPFPSWIYKTSELRDLTKDYANTGIYGDVVLLGSILQSGVLCVSTNPGMAYRKHEQQMSAHTSVLNRNKFMASLRRDENLTSKKNVLDLVLYSYRVSMCLDYYRRHGVIEFLRKYSLLMRWVAFKSLINIYRNPKVVKRLVFKMIALTFGTRLGKASRVK